MGRKPTVNLNLPAGMRPRKKAKGKIYYYFDTGAKPRREIPLGDDYIIALRKYADLRQGAAPVSAATFGDVIKRYETTELPKLAANTIRVQRSDIRHVTAKLGTLPIEEFRPMHIRQFMDKLQAKPTTANRCKRLISTMWNHAREWGYTDAANPCQGIKGFSLEKRTVYISDEVYAAVHKCAGQPLRDAMDLAYLTGQRPADALLMTEHDIVDGHLIITQEKTKQPLRITISGKLAELIGRIHVRKETHKVVTGALLVNMAGKRLTKTMLRNAFDDARDAAAKEFPALAHAIGAFWFYDLRAKAADDTSADRGEQAASDLLGHDSVRTTQRHYLRRGKTVAPTK